MSYLRYFGSHKGYNDFDLPFKVKFNFSAFIKYWEDLAEKATGQEAAHAQKILKILDKAPELKEAFDDDSIIEKYKDEIKLLLSPLFPPLTTDNEIK
ncbi:MAG: hypothetical protein ACI8P3_004239, partial [Saprospiraceae bacterium]